LRTLVSDTNAVAYHDFKVYEFFELEKPPQVVAAQATLRRTLDEDWIRLSFAAETGRLYELQQKVPNGENDWERIELFEGAGETRIIEFRVTEGSAGDYRVLRSNASLEELPVLYTTNFFGVDYETPDGWNLRQGDPFWGTRFEDHYDFDYRFGTSAATFLAVLETDGAEAWTDYLITTSVKTLRAEDPVSNRTITPGLVGRIGLNQTSNAYHPRLWLRQDWPATWTEGEKGGRLEIFRLGGPGNTVLSQTSRFLSPDPDPDPENPLPEPPDVAVRMHFYLLGEDLLASIWDDEGNLLTQSATRDASFSQGAPGIRVSTLRDGIVSYDNFNVYDLSGVTFDPISWDEVHVASMFEASFMAPVALHNYQIRGSSNLVDWEEIGDELIARGGAGGLSRQRVSIELEDGERGFIQVLTRSPE
jgi:hypothetical protein